MAEVRLDDIKPNSYKSKEIKQPSSAPKAKPVVSKSAVVSTKKPLGQRFKDAFIAEDAADIKSWLVQDILIPGVKNTVIDMLSMLFFSKTGGGNRRSSSYSFYRPTYGYGGASYASYYNGQSRQQYNGSGNAQGYVSHNNKVNYRDIVLERRDDAERVVNEMLGRIAEFGSVSVAAMLDMMEITSDFNDNNWGWTHPNSVGIRRVPNGWLIDVAEAEPLEN